MPVTVRDRAEVVVGTFETIQEAITAASSGYYIDLDAGDYDVSGTPITVDKSLTFRGTNAGVAGYGPGRSNESTIIGSSAAQLFELADANISVVFDGIKFVGDSILDEGSAGQSVSFLFSVFDIAATQANSIYMGYAGGYDFRFEYNKVEITGYTEFMDLFEGGNINVNFNSFTGRDGSYVVGKDNDVPLIVNISNGSGAVSGNRFTHVDIGVLVANATGPLNITNNTFEDLHRYEGATAGGKAAGIVFFTPGPFNGTIAIGGNRFEDADAGIRTSGVPGSTTDGSDIVIRANDFTDVDSPLFQPEAVTGTLTATDSMVDGEGVAAIYAAGAGTHGYSANADLGANSFRYDLDTASWSVRDGESTVLLTGFDRVEDNTGEVFLLVRGGGYATIQAAVDAATGGESILIAPGEYTETKTTVHGTSGLYVNTANLTLWGYDGNDGTLVASGVDAQFNGPTVISGAQNGFGANHWIDIGGTGVKINGLHLQAGPTTNNKLLEIWADDVTISHNFLDTFVGGNVDGLSWAYAVYLNEVAGEPIAAYNIHGNVLNEGIVVANAVGVSSEGVSETQRITNNLFETAGFDPADPKTFGRYDMVAVQGTIPGVGWQTDPAQVPTISGNMRSDNSAPFLFRMTEQQASLFPTLAELVAAVEANSDATTTYAYVVDGLDPRLVVRGSGDDAYHQLFVANGIDTLNLGLDDTADAVFGGKRATMEAGDLVVVQSGQDAVDSQIMVEGLTVLATEDSADLDLTLATEYADETGIAGGGVRNVTLADYAAGRGADVDVTGNALDNAITGNSGDNALFGRGGDDRLEGGAGQDVIDGGAGDDTAVYGQGATVALGEDGWTVTEGGTAETLTDVEIVETGGGRTLLVDQGGYDTIQAAVDDAREGDTILVAPGTYKENVVISVGGITLLSTGGRGATTIAGVQSGGELGTIQLKPGVNDVTIGSATGGFTILGLNGNGAVEKGGIYLQGTHDGIDIVGNEIVARGDLGLVSEYNLGVTDILIDGNIFSGKTFEGDYVSGPGVDQFAAGNNVPRQLVAIGGGNAASNPSSDVRFVNNIVSGLAGGETAAGSGVFRGNTLVTVDANDSLVQDNQFTGDTVGFNGALRTRGAGTDVIDNALTGKSAGVFVANQGTPGTYSGNSYAGTGGADAVVYMTPGDDTVSGGAGNDTLLGQDGKDTLNGGADNDILSGGAGDDTLTGGDGTDAAAYAGQPGAYVIAGERTAAGRYTSFTGVSGGSEGADTLSEVEVLSFGNNRTFTAGAPVQMFDADGDLVGTFATIQGAADAAQGTIGHRIVIAGGTYAEQVRVSNATDLSFVEDGEVTVLAPADVVQTGTRSTGQGLEAVFAVTGSTNVTLAGLKIDGAGAGNSVTSGNGYVGVLYRNSSGAMTDVDVVGVRDAYPGGTTPGDSPVQSGNQRGVAVMVDNDAPAANAPLLKFTMTGGTLSDFQKNATVFNRADLDVSGVTITGGGAQPINAQNGFQASNSTGSISGNTITDLGYSGPENASASGMILFGNTDLEVTGNTIIGANGESAAAKVVGISIIDFGPDNSGGSVTGNIISFVDQGVYVSGQIQPEGIEIADNTVTDLDTAGPSAAGVFFAPDAGVTTPLSVEGTAETDVLSGAAGGDTLDGAGGADTLRGNGGNDNLVGGGGTDTAVFAGARSGYVINGTQDAATGRYTSFQGVTDSDASNGDEGTDTLLGVELLRFADGETVSLVGDVQLIGADGRFKGGFNTIQAAIDAAASGDTVDVGAGDYAENLVITTSGITLKGAPDRASIIRPGTSDAIDGNVITVRADNVTITGFTIDGANSELDAQNGVVLPDGVESHAARLISNYKDSLGGGFASDGVTITDNSLMHGQRMGVVFANQGASRSGGNLVENNDFSGMAGIATTGSYRIGVLLSTEGYADIKNNRMVDVGEGIQASTLGQGDPNGTPLEISGNTISAQRGIMVNNIYTADSDVVVRNNTLTYGATAAGSAGNQIGIRIWSVYNGGSAVFVDNDIKGFEYGYRASNNLDEIRIKGGTVTDAGIGVELWENYPFGLSGSQFGTENRVVLDGVTITGSKTAHTRVDDSNEGKGGVNQVMMLVFDANGQPTLTGNVPDVVLVGDTAGFAPNGYDDALVVRGDSNPNEIKGGDGDDALTGNDGADLMEGGLGDDTLTGNAGNDTLQGGAGEDSLDGGMGDDTLEGGAGDDALEGDAGTDTAVFAGPRSGYTINGTKDANGFYTSFQSVTDDRVDGNGGTDTLSGVEQLRFADGNTVSLVGRAQLVDADGNFVGAFATIQDAIDAAGEDYTINLAPGDYEERITIDVAGLTINGAGATLKGSLVEDYGIEAGGLYEHLTGPNASAPDTTGVGMTVAADRVTINGLDVSGWYDAALLGEGTDGLTLNGVDFLSNLNGLRKAADADVTGLTINDGSFADGYIGLLIFKDASAGNAANGNLSDVLISGTGFTDLARKGIYTETLSDAWITGISMTNVGQYGAAAGLDGTNGTFGAGINLNLKNGTYSDVEIDNFTLNGVGASKGAGSSHFAGAAIAITARDDGSYASAPAKFTGAVVIRDGSISGELATGIAVGEPGKANADPDVTVTNVTVVGEQSGAAFGTVANNADGATLTFGGTAGDDVIFASGDTDGPVVLDGLAGVDLLTGGKAGDTLNGGGDSDRLFGLDGADTLNGGAGADTLYGGAGADSMAGGDGDDNYVVDSADDVVVENANEGRDRVISSVTYTLSPAVENLLLTGDEAIDGTGNGAANIITGNGAANSLRGEGGDDTLVGGAGADRLEGGADTDTADYSLSAAGVTVDLAAGTGVGGDAAGDTLLGVENLVGSGEADTLRGDAGANELAGAGGNDTLDGRGGIDAMTGGAGDDSYIVDNSADAAIEQAGGGKDRVTSSVSYTLSDDVEDLLLTGTTNLNGTGNSGDNAITGNTGNNVLTGGAGDDRLDGGAGSDTLIGGEDDDTYVVGTGDAVVEQAENGGVDTIETALTSYTLAANLENLTYLGSAAFTGTGNGVANFITGGSGADRLDGKAGADTLEGLAGNDTYIVDNADDVVVEVADGGVDLVGSTVSYTLGANVENLNLGGSGAISGTGNDENNAIRGNDGANKLRGEGGNDTLDGGAGADQMIGGTGNDTFIVNRPDDQVVEEEGEGDDLVITDTNNYVLADNVENLTLRGSSAVTGTGNALNNVITGNSKANTLKGLGGDDTYVIGTSDLVVEAAGEGTDTVSTALTSYTLTTNVEKLVYTGSSSFIGNGNGLANEITGGSGNDVLDGKAGADLMDGGAGNDTYFVDNVGDVIQDSAGVDTVATTFNSFGLTDGLENLRFTGTGDFAGTGNAAVNRIEGGSGNDRLDGGAGADTLVGGGGDDTYVVDSSSDAITEAAGGGDDTVETGASSYTLGGNVENLIYTGSGSFTGTGDAGANTIRGADRGDTLNGGGGVDTLIGLAGDDVYIVDVAGDVVIDTSGNDTVRSTAASYALGEGVESLVLLGSGNFAGTGNALNNTLTGNGGANRLDGGLGADTMTGGAGSDTYVVDDLGDVVTEGSGSSNGSADTVETTLAAYTLRTNFERLIYKGDGNFTGTGNSANNVITGGKGNDVLDGAGGTDEMIGLGGNDTYYVSRAEDKVVEALNGGVDLVLSAAETYTLAANVDNLRLIDGGDNATGNALANQITGNNLANVLDGGAGVDELRGGSGNDTFLFKKGQANEDKVMDFTGAGAASGDKLQLSGFGTYADGARIAQVGTTDFYTVTSADGSVTETIQIVGVYNLNTGAGSNDYLFG